MDIASLSTTSSSKPVLDSDVLWEIFSLLASFDQSIYYESQPLKALRIASHVCTSWRQLIISSPLLWARIINLDELNQKTANWRSEVIRRTGDAVLSIKGSGGRLSAKWERFIVSLLRDNWYRIKYVQICLSYLSLHRQSVFSQILQTPAPHLEYFYVWRGSLEVVYSRKRKSRAVEAAEETATGDDSWTCHTASFGGQAPKLEHFSCANLLLPAVEQTCFSQVVHLECGETNGEVLLNALAFMPKIETLHVHIIEDLPDIPIFSPTHIVSLPHLHHVRIITDTVWQVGLKILNSLRPCPGFQLEFDVRDDDGNISIEDANFIKRVLAPFLTNTPWHSTEGNILEIKLYDAMLAIDTRPAQFRLDFFSLDSISDLTSILSIPHSMFLHATKLDIDIKGADYIFGYDNNVVQFLSSLSVVHSLRTDMGTLQYIHRLSSRYHDRHLLPSLSHLELHYYEVEFASAFEEFLDYRRDVYGTPIQSITCDGLWGRNLTFLERFDGVVFRGYFIKKEVYYVCGSGSPETLDFTATARVKPNHGIARKSVHEILEKMRTEPESDEEGNDEEESNDEE